MGLGEFVFELGFEDGTTKHVQIDIPIEQLAGMAMTMTTDEQVRLIRDLMINDPEVLYRVIDLLEKN